MSDTQKAVAVKDTTDNTIAPVLVQELTPNDRLNRDLAVAKSLTDFIGQTDMALNIKGNRYIKAEAWNYIFSLFDLRPIITKTGMIADGTYKARCELLDKNDKIVVAADAVCSKSEYAKRTFDDYALLSMAETRAVAKAGRLKFGYFVSLAGFNPTPAEEIDCVISADIQPAPASNTQQAPASPCTQNQYTQDNSFVGDHSPATQKQKDLLLKMGEDSALVDTYDMKMASSEIVRLIAGKKAEKTKTKSDAKPVVAQPMEKKLTKAEKEQQEQKQRVEQMANTMPDY
jgi:hypothetical protein